MYRQYLDIITMNKSSSFREGWNAALKLLTCTDSDSIVTTIGSAKMEINYTEVKSWTVSYDRLMQNTVGRSLFRDYLHAEHAEENIQFWEAVEHYRTLTSEEEDVDETVEEIYNSFVSEKALREVSLDSKCRMNLETSLSRRPRSRQIFDDAQSQVYKTMERDNYPRFQRSKLYLDFLLKQIPVDTVATWSTNFDHLMSHDEGRRLFNEYLSLEKADENMRFYEAVADYKRTSNLRHRKTRAREIFKQFISVEAKTEVSLDGPTREAVAGNYERADSKLFDAAEKHIYLLMMRDCYPRFVKSSFFRAFLNGGHPTNPNATNTADVENDEPIVDELED